MRERWELWGDTILEPLELTLRENVEWLPRCAFDTN
jgi:hypothetical protein